MTKPFSLSRDDRRRLFLARYPWLYKLGKSIYHRKFPLPDALIQANTIMPVIPWLKGLREGTFVVVGANDGLLWDPLARFLAHLQYRGLFIEPDPYYFAKLKENFPPGAQFKHENSAVHATERTMFLYRVKPDRIPSDAPAAAGGGTFLRDVHLSKDGKSGWTEDDIDEVQVPCRPFMTICADHGMTRADVIQIDTEGHDWEVIQQIDFNALQTRIVFFEHLFMSEALQQEVIAFLGKAGFSCVKLQDDIVARRKLP